MPFIVKKKVHGKTYAYEYTTIWDKVNKKYKKNSKYLGKVDEQTGRLPLLRKKRKLNLIFQSPNSRFWRFLCNK